MAQWVRIRVVTAVAQVAAVAQVRSLAQELPHALGMAIFFFFFFGFLGQHPPPAYGGSQARV